MTTSRDLRRWLASGRCQSPSGAFYAWIDGETGAPAFEYPEITGYALTHFAGVGDLNADERAAAHAAARWLVARVRAGDLAARAGWDNNAVYNFDLGMMASGLIAFGQRAGEEAYVDAGRALVAYMMAQMEGGRPLGSIGPGPSSTSRASGWSTDGHAHLLKVVQCLLLADQVGHPGAGEAAGRLVERVGSMQREDGRFVTQPDDEVVMLHPHLYAVEGLWMWGTARGDVDALGRARAAIEWAWQHQLESGGLPRFAAMRPDRGNAPEQGDVTSQAVRMGLALNPALPGLPRAVARLREIAHRDTGGRALPYQPAAETAHLNAWVTLFGHQALSMAEDGPQRLVWQYVV